LAAWGRDHFSYCRGRLLSYHYRRPYLQELPKTAPVFWFMMQIAMIAGFLTSYPVNCWLIHKGIKESM
jgi:hypothetical protein